jgi:hypothetical protein
MSLRNGRVPKSMMLNAVGSSTFQFRREAMEFTRIFISLRPAKTLLTCSYAWILVIQAVAYYGKLAIHPAPLATLADLWERAAIGPIPGGLVVVAGVLFHGGWAVFALITYRIEVASRRERRSLIAMG